MIVFISCVKKKKNYECVATELYDSDFFKKSLKYALKLSNNVYILLAKYGLVELNQIISPYERTLNNMNKKERMQWAEKVHNQMILKNIDFNENVVWLCGKKYREFLMKYFLNNETPLNNLGIGKQLKYMKEQIGE